MDILFFSNIMPHQRALFFLLFSPFLTIPAFKNFILYSVQFSSHCCKVQALTNSMCNLILLCKQNFRFFPALFFKRNHTLFFSPSFTTFVINLRVLSFLGVA